MTRHRHHRYTSRLGNPLPQGKGDTGGSVEATLRAKLREFQSTVVFGAFRDADGKFVHFMSTGADAPAMLKGRASMAKNGVLNELEGCVR